MLTFKQGDTTLRVDAYTYVKENKPVLKVNLEKLEDGGFKTVSQVDVDLEGISILNMEDIVTEWVNTQEEIK